MTDYVGQQLGNYRLIRQIGQGGFADVYLGEHVLIKKFAAVKILHTTLTATEAEEFRKEAQTLADLNHPNIVDVYDYGLIGGTPFIIMSYAMNDSLRQRHPWNPQATPINLVPYIKQVADALDYVHLKKLIHRDIKPENILLGHNDRVLLGDFGIALVVQQQIRQAAAGTIEYMAPEQIKGRACAASDQYSLGIVVYEWLCGVHPFTGPSSKIVQHHLYDPPPPLRTIVPSMPLLVEQVVLKALEKDPQKRFANVKAFATALEQAYQYSPSPSHPSSGTAATPTKVLPGALTTVLPVQPPLATTVLVKQEPGTCLYTYNRHRNFVQAAAWSPNSLRIASASDDRTVQVWDALTVGNVFI